MTLILPSLLLANQAAVNVAGLLDVLGAAWETYPVAQLPATLDGHIAGVLDFGTSEGGEASIRMVVRDGGGAQLGAEASIVVRSARRLAPFALRFTCVVEATGPFSVSIEDDDGALGRVDCEVVLVQQA